MKSEKEPLSMSDYKKGFKLINQEIDARVITHNSNNQAF